MSDAPRYAFLAHGELFVGDGGGPPKKIESAFAGEYKARVRSIRRKQSWKEEGAGARFMRGGGSALWGDSMDLEAVPVAFTGIARGRGPNELLYSLSTGVVGGVFAYDLASGEERRIFHSADHRIEALATSDAHDVVACTIRRKDGTSAIAVMAADGSEIFEVTDGDVIDLAPAWLPPDAIEGDRRHQLVYQSAGIGRDAGGLFVAVGPASVVMLDAEHGDIRTLLEDERREFLAPRMGPDRALYCIRHPYETADAPRPLRTALDALLFPFRLLAAVFGYLSFFTLRYTGKPLLTSGSARQRSADLRQMMMTGNLAAARAEANDAAEKAAAEAVRDWELVRVSEGKEETVLAERVRAFDRLRDGRLLVTDGARLELVDGAGRRTVLAKAAGITTVVALS